MSESLFLTILSLGELALVTAGFATFLYLRYRRVSKQLNDAKKALRQNDQNKAKNQKNYSDYLQQYIRYTEEKLTDLPPDQKKALRARLAFLHAEVNAQKNAENSEAYWKQLIHDLNAILPQEPPEQENPATSVSASDPPSLSELDDIDINSDLQIIPTLDNKTDELVGVRKDPTLTIASANEDLERLRKIISRQHNTMDELKKSLSDKDIDFQNNHELSRKLEEVEIAQAQLNMCVETLEKENERLHELLKEYEESPPQEQLLKARHDLAEANERIHDLEKENTLQGERIAQLEAEILELQAALDERNAELSRLQGEHASLSHTSEPLDQDSLMKEIETLTELITQKSEELSRLQMEHSQEDEINGELPELTVKAANPAKAVKSR